ncbi:MAG: exo-beta-N-acetylmuramidase NamZ family protein [Acidobacteriota bacterium]
MSVELGSTRLLTSGRLRGCRVGLVSNPASVNETLRHLVACVAEHRDIEVAALFGPQHGFRSDVQDDMIETPHADFAVGPRRRVPLYSLYSDTREPTPAMLEGLDAIVIDLQDIGTRIYTYVYTMANCLRAARRHGVRVVVCDRPNPIGGLDIEGPTLEAGCESFVGQFPIPTRHGLTVGELARLFNEQFGIGAELDVVPMAGWQRSMYWEDTGLPWVMPSPNVPTVETTKVFPGMVHIEGTTASEGRGTTKPFELVGAPWVDAESFAAALNGKKLPGVYFRPVVFEPTFQKHARTPCGGCQIHVLDRNAFRPVLTGVAVLEQLRAADPSRFGWKPPPYEYEPIKEPIDVIAGTPSLRASIDGGERAEEVAARWEASGRAFRDLRQAFLLYD